MDSIEEVWSAESILSFCRQDYAFCFHPVFTHPGNSLLEFPYSPSSLIVGSTVFQEAEAEETQEFAKRTRAEQNASSLRVALTPIECMLIKGMRSST